MRKESKSTSEFIVEVREYLETFFDEHFMDISDERLDELLKERKIKQTETLNLD